MHTKITKKALRKAQKLIFAFINNNPTIVSITFEANRKRRKNDDRPNR